MRGIEDLIRVRMAGRVPEVLWVDLDFDGPKQPGSSVRIEPKDKASTLDLRAVQGLVVAVSGADGERAKRVAELCVQSGARRVITTIYGDNRKPVEMLDTEGVMTWKC